MSGDDTNLAGRRSEVHATPAYWADLAAAWEVYCDDRGFGRPGDRPDMPEAFWAGYDLGRMRPADVSRETSEADPLAADPMRVPLGTLVDVVPRSRTKATLAAAASTRGTFIRWVGVGAMDRDAVIEVEVGGRLTGFLTRDYAVRLVR